MAEWIETCRSTVAPWECDITEHFTIACYADRIDQASTTLADLLDLADHVQNGVFPRRFTLRFVRELRVGASFHVESAPIGLDSAMRFGHRFVDSVNSETVTWVEEVWETVPLSDAQRKRLAEALASWDESNIEERPDPTATTGSIATARGRVRPGDLDEFGRFTLAAFVHRFTDANIQIMAAIGMTSDYIKAERRGYSTFELALRIAASPRLGDHYLIETGIAHLGNSSMRFFHRMWDPRSRQEYARLGQFGVQLDLDARRPAPLPDAIRTAATRLLLPTG